MKNDTAVLYVHGKGGNAAEAEHYKPLFPMADVFGLDYKTDLPWETNKEIEAEIDSLKSRYEKVILIANSIGAFYSMNADINDKVDRAFLISPMVDMEKMISNMMMWAGVNEKELREKKIIPVDFGDDLSWDYLCYVRETPIVWTVPTDILYGSEDNLTSYDSMKSFADKTGSSLTVMQGGEHWFHTDEQMKFLDDWIRRSLV